MYESQDEPIGHELSSLCDTGNHTLDTHVTSAAVHVQMTFRRHDDGLTRLEMGRSIYV